MSIMQANIPGVTPPRNSAGTVAEGTSTLYTMNATDGGIRMSVEPAAAVTAAANGGG